MGVSPATCARVSVKLPGPDKGLAAASVWAAIERPPIWLSPEPRALCTPCTRSSICQGPAAPPLSLTLSLFLSVGRPLSPPKKEKKHYCVCLCGRTFVPVLRVLGSTTYRLDTNTTAVSDLMQCLQSSLKNKNIKRSRLFLSPEKCFNGNFCCCFLFLTSAVLFSYTSSFLSHLMFSHSTENTRGWDVFSCSQNSTRTLCSFLFKCRHTHTRTNTYTVSVCQIKTTTWYF